ncbi:hypothetical protein AUJ66_07785 [Candidatus Desantisbacteria bacterium CG1_02_38_46]|uniref:Pilus assembly protein PilO n=1 Tax=Candidatus Desantisbacteria bacterium CG1_02_38_46 TaxID=1817893 RepID=A0A1J4S937_9BACT|nr:MAG: hypothetical protein AUJ66_07785 [Candidatus Desantisbacteria bacterium CG1_02_38_46]
MSPIKLSRRMWVMLILPTAGVIALFIFISRPKFKEIKKLSDEIVKANEELQETQKIARMKDKLIEEINKLRESIIYYERRIPGEKATSWLLIELSRVARQTGIKYASITPQPEEKKELYIRVPIKIEIQCGYHSLGKFLSKIENSQRFMDVDDIVISPDAANPLKHRVSMKISTFMLAPEVKQ